MSTLEDNEELKTLLTNRFQKVQDWYLTLEDGSINKNILEAMPERIWLDAWTDDFIQHQYNSVLSKAYNTLTLWDWLQRCSTPSQRRLYSKKAKQIKQVANDLEGTPYQQKLLEISCQLEAEEFHPIMESAKNPKRKMCKKTYIIRKVHDILCLYLPIKTNNQGNDEAPWQSSPNKETALIASILLKEKVTSNDVTQAIKDERRKNYLD